MSYIIHHTSIRKVKHFLDAVLAKPYDDNSFPSENPYNDAYLIRQAFTAAMKLSIEPYNRMYALYKVRSKKNRIIIEYNGLVPDIQLHFDRLQEKEYTDADTIDKIVFALISDSKLYTKFIFPAVLEEFSKMSALDRVIKTLGLKFEEIGDKWILTKSEE